MAAHSAARAVHNTLVASTEDTVSLTASFARVRIVNRGTGDIFVTVDGTAITAAGQDDTQVVPSGTSLSLVNPSMAGATVNLFSTGTPAYSVLGD